MFAMLAFAAPACLLETEVEAPLYEDGYQPVFYDGYVVYYDAAGRPYYYVDGGLVWIAPGSPRYFELHEHWRVYGHSYGRWYSSRGYRYRGYHAGPAPTRHPHH